MHSRRGFLKTLFGTAAAVATGGAGKLVEALTTKRVARQLGLLDAGYVFAPYIPLQVVQIEAVGRKLTSKWTCEEVVCGFDGKPLIQGTLKSGL